MRGRWLANLLLAVLVVALALLAREELARPPGVGVLTDLDPERLGEIAILRDGAVPVRLARREGRWRLLAPYQVDADQARAQQLAGIAATPVHRSLTDADLAPLGLDPATIRLTLDGLVLRFGETDPIGHLRYVAVGDLVHLIDDGHRHHLLAAPEAWVDRRLLPVGFVPTAGRLDGRALDAGSVARLAELTAVAVEPLGKTLSGRLLSLTGEDGRSLRLLVSDDGRRVSHLQQRLTYRLADALALSVAPPAPSGASTPAPEEAWTW